MIDRAVRMERNGGSVVAKNGLFRRDNLLKLAAVLCAVAALVQGTLQVILWLIGYFSQAQMGNGNAVIIGGADGPTAIYVASNGFFLSPGWIGIALAAVALAITLYLTKTDKKPE